MTLVAGDNSIPAHVPSHLVRDFDFLNLPEGRDLYDWYKSIQDETDIFYTPRHDGHWVVTRHDDIAHVLQSHEDFSSVYQTIPKAGMVLPVPPIDLDPPVHADFRRLLAPFFSPKAVGDLEQKAVTLSRNLIDEFYANGRCDFVQDFALKMPIGIFMSLLDLPEDDRLPLLRIAEDMVRGETVDRQRQGFEDAFAYLSTKIAERRAAPGGADILSAMIAGRVEGGRPLTDTEMLGMGALVLAGGLDTVAGALGFFALHLARHPQHRQYLVEHPEKMNSAVEELMRRYQIAAVARVVVRDMEYKGVLMKAGDMVLTATAFAGVDDRQYADSMASDFDRPDKKSLIFGRGVHQCIGAYLARTELRVFLREWLTHIPDFQVEPGEEPVLVSGRACTIHYLPLSWTVE